jgi:hypothetical protein
VGRLLHDESSGSQSKRESVCWGEARS